VIIVAAPTKKPASPNPVTTRIRTSHQSACTTPYVKVDALTMPAPPMMSTRRPIRSPTRPAYVRNVIAPMANAPTAIPTATLPAPSESST
jgi:hypothetical protein